MRFIIWSGAAVLALSVAIAAVAGPWLRVASVPVEAEIQAPPDAKLLVCSGITCVRLLQKDELWLGELPPLRRMEPVIKSDLPVVVRSVRLVRTNAADPNPSRLDSVLVFFLSTVMLSLAAGVAYAFRTSSPAALPIRHRSPRFYWTAWGVLSVAGVVLVASLPIQFSGDTPIYLRHAISMLDGNYTFPGADPWSATVRPPGYPALLAMVFLFTRELSIATLIQYVLHAVAIGLLGSVLNVKSKALQVLFLGFGLLGLQHILINRALLSDGLCTSLIVLSLYFYFRFKADGGRWLVWFGICAGSAALVRPAAALVLVIVVPDAISAAYRVLQQRESMARHRALMAAVALAAAPMLMAV